MVDLTYSELASNLSTSTPNSLTNAANAAANVVCDLYEQFPTGIIPSVGSTPISDITDGLLRNLCAPRNKLPAPKALPFTGGQCSCVLYNVDYNATTAEGVTFNSGTTINGPIASVKVGFTGVRGNGTQGVGIITTGRNAACNGPRTATDLAGSNPGLKINSVTVTRNDNNPDTCGNPLPQYNDDTTINNYSTPVDINLGGINVTVPVTIIPTVFAPVNIFRPELNVDVGGINVNFALDGITFSPSINIDSPVTLPFQDPRPVLPPSKPQKPSTCPSVDLDPIFDRFDNVDNQLDIIESCACGPDQVLRVQNYAPANSRTITLPSNTVGVRVFITSVGVKVPSQYGNGGAPDVLFVGWCSFGNGTPSGLRVPIQHEQAYFPAPERATAFSYTVVYESLARLEVIYLEDVIP